MSTKLNKTVYNKILLQANEAKDLGLTKLAGSVFFAIGSVARDEDMVYNEASLLEDVEKDLWKIATNIIAYHDLRSADIQAIEGAIDEVKLQIVANIERALGVEGKVGALEGKLPGQK